MSAFEECERATQENHMNELKMQVQDVVNRFENNGCRLCRSVFCCPNCRQRHEVRVHKIHVDCGLCIHGLMALGPSLPKDLIQHVIETHLQPMLRCAFCNRQITKAVHLTASNECVITKFTEDELIATWDKIPVDIRKQCKRCTSSATGADANSAVSQAISANEPIGTNMVTYDSPTTTVGTHSDFNEGAAIYSTPMQSEAAITDSENIQSVSALLTNTEDKNDENQPVADVEIVPNAEAEGKKEQVPDSTVADECKIERNRKVKFDMTPKPATPKLDKNYADVLKSSLKKVDSEENAETCSASPLQNNVTTSLNPSLSESDSNVEYHSLKSFNQNEIVKLSNTTTICDEDDALWVTAIDDDVNDCKVAIIIQNIDGPSSEQLKIQHACATEQRDNVIDETDVEDVRSKGTDTCKDEGDGPTLWAYMTSCLTKVFEYTSKPAVKRSRDEFESSLDVCLELEPYKETKRRRLLVHGRRPIHHYLKPEGRRDVKKVTRAIQTSLEN